MIEVRVAKLELVNLSANNTHKTIQPSLRRWYTLWISESPESKQGAPGMVFSRNARNTMGVGAVRNLQ